MNRADPSIGLAAPEQNPITNVIASSTDQCREGTAVSSARSPGRFISVAGPAHPASSLRLTLASRLGNPIDGAWWPRTPLISRELPDLVSALNVRLGQVIGINVNWSSLQRQPDLNWAWWQGIDPQVMTIVGRDARAKLLIVPHRTGTALAVMVLRRAAGLPVYPTHHDSRAFKVAECIVRVAEGERMFEVRHPRRGKSQVVADPPTAHA